MLNTCVVDGLSEIPLSGSPTHESFMSAEQDNPYCAAPPANCCRRDAELGWKIWLCDWMSLTASAPGLRSLPEFPFGFIRLQAQICDPPTHRGQITDMV
jgi:hypothetical protein